MMTKDEALRGLTIGDCRTRREAVKTVKELLNREECEDAISRQAALDCFTATKLKKFDFILHAREEIKKLPPVNPQKCDTCEVGNPCLYCKHEFEPQERSDKE